MKTGNPDYQNNWWFGFSVFQNYIFCRVLDIRVSEVMDIWLAENIRAHSFIPAAYWRDYYKMVREMMPQTEVYVYEDGETHRISGFIGLTENYIARLFVRESSQSTGAGGMRCIYGKKSI